MQPQAPELFPYLALGRIAVLVESFQVAKHTGELFPRDTEFLWIHGSLPQFTTGAEAGLGW
jgi:hypothetical protein